MTYREENELLKAFGCKDVKYNNLVNNYYIKFNYKDKKYIAEHILNVYGAEVDWWELCLKEEESNKTFHSLQDLLNYIK